MIDTHSHLFCEEFNDDLDATIQRAKEAGVARIYMPNIDDESIDDLLRVCRAYPDYCFPMMGFHPTSVDERWKERLEVVHRALQESLQQPETHLQYVGIGEVGMDLYWDKTYLREQQLALDEQIQWALQLDLPLIIHCREAYPELFEVMAPYRGTALRGIFHSFTGTAAEAEQVMTYERFKIGVNGVFTFKKSPLPDIFTAHIPLDRLVLETDSPYLAPVPYRGRRNESSFVGSVRKKLAEVYQRTEDEIDEITTQNATKLFTKPDRVFKIH
jgi:TatD DNase family protein